MKKILVALTIVLLHAGVFATGLRAQDVHLYLTEHELPNLVKCLPAPPDTIGEAFTHDIMRYMWGKTQRLDSVRLAQAKRDAIWNLDTTRVIYSEPFGYAIDPEKTPEIYRLFVNGVSTIEQIRFRPKAHYFRMRPYARFHESSIFPQDDAWLATEGSYPSGHTIRAWSAALILAEVNPNAAEALFHRAVESGESRVIAGCHWQSDVDASASAACIGFAILQANAEYRAQAERAREEFKRISGIPPLKAEFICDFADWTPESEEVTGSTQGFAMYDKYAFVLHDKGRICIFDMKKKRLAANFLLEGNTSHCNNACFGVEKASRRSKFPLLYIASCGGENCCYVTDISLQGSRIVQKIFYTGTDYAGTIDWCLDAENGFIYTYGGRNGDYKLLKKFRLPKLADSDENGEVHLTDADVLDVTRLDEGINIWQGSIVRGRYAYLPDGYAPYELFLHLVDLEQKRIVVSRNVTDLVDEPEGICLADGYAYVVFHTSREPRHSKLWRFSLEP
ncbi:MAG: phosphatase PAP2 family protein [Bacteroidales bacterium]|nr:phosphatase PAP2 family protein [Bacteroidales bacterium]